MTGEDVDRRERIINRLTEAGIEVELFVDETMRLDYVPPATDPTLTINPTRMVELTAHLDDEVFEQYLDAIEWMNNEHIKRMPAPLDDRIRSVENYLYDIAPGSLALLSAVQLEALS